MLRDLVGFSRTLINWQGSKKWTFSKKDTQKPGGEFLFTFDYCLFMRSGA